MRDLVETVIGQVLKQEPQYKREGKTSAQSHVFKTMMQDAKKTPSSVMMVQGEEIKNKPLWQASVKFEAMLFQQMMAAMRKTVPKDGLLKHGFAEDVQQSMFDQAIASAAGKQGSLGLAMNIYRQVERVSDASTQPGMIQEMRQATDNKDKAKFLSLKGGWHGGH